jgi:histidyl-tRNA synthetase
VSAARRRSGRTAPGRLRSDRIGSDRIGSDRIGSDREIISLIYTISRIFIRRLGSAIIPVNRRAHQERRDNHKPGGTMTTTVTAHA